MIQIQELRFGYGAGQFELHIDELELATGVRAACIGPSGSGKTTLIQLITGILVPAAGRVFLAGREVTAMNDAERRALRIGSVGMVFQDFALLDYLSALDNVLLPYLVAKHLSLTRVVRERAHRLADALGIAPVLGRRPERLSQGERQRVAVCRALVTEPQLVICDEPTGNLDPATASGLLDLLFDAVRSQDATLVVVTHDHGLLERFDRVVDMRTLIAGGTRA